MILIGDVLLFENDPGPLDKWTEPSSKAAVSECR
jgi:hypothetical protein